MAVADRALSHVVKLYLNSVNILKTSGSLLRFNFYLLGLFPRGTSLVLTYS